MKTTKNSIFLLLLMFFIDINTSFANPNPPLEVFPKPDIKVIDFAAEDFSWKETIYQVFYNYKDGYDEEELEFLRTEIAKSKDIDEPYAIYVRNALLMWERAKTAYKEFTKFRAKKLLEPNKTPIPLSEMQDDISDSSSNKIKSRDNNQQSYVVKDFRKVVNYEYSKELADSIRDRNKTSQSLQKLSDIKPLDMLSRGFEDMNFKDFLFLDINGKSPFTGTKGIGEWSKTDPVKFRLLSEYAYIGHGKKTLMTGLFIGMPKDYIFDWHQENNLKIDLSKSENIANYELKYPTPYLIRDRNVIGYRNIVLIPVEIEREDVLRPIDLKSSVSFEVCNKEKCQQVKDDVSLDIETDIDSISSPASSMINTFSYMHAKSDFSKIEITKLFLEPSSIDDNKNYIRVEAISEEFKPKLAQTFLKSDNIKTGTSKTSIDGNKIISRIEVLNDNLEEVLDSEVTAFVRIQHGLSAKKTFILKKASVFSYSGSKLTLGLLLLAILGGFILNLMPCIFPVLALKIFSLSKFGGANKESVINRFKYFIFGVFASFILLGCITAGLKYLGVQIGWGVQFQEPLFLLFIMFLLTLFMANFYELFSFNIEFFSYILPSKLQEKINKSNSQYVEEFLSGILITMLAIPCSAPFLATAIGFALTKGIVDILIIFIAIAFGLTLPYFVLFLKPDLAHYIPKPDKWLSRTKFIIGLLIFGTIIWVLDIYAAQIGRTAMIITAIGLFLIYYAFFVYKVINSSNPEEFMESISKSELIKKSMPIVKLIMLLGITTTITSTIYYKHKNYSNLPVSNLNLWQEYDKDKIKQDVESGKIVFVTIGANWCMTCRVNEGLLLKTNNFEKMIKEGTISAFYGDWTKYDAEILSLLDSYGRKAIPFNIIFGPRIPEGKLLPEFITPTEFYDELRFVKDL